MGIYQETDQELRRTGILQDYTVYMCKKIGLELYAMLKRMFAKWEDVEGTILFETVYKR